MKLFKKMNFSTLSLIMGLAWPTILEQLMQTAVQYVDTAMVGSLGTRNMLPSTISVTTRFIPAI